MKFHACLASFLAFSVPFSSGGFAQDCNRNGVPDFFFINDSAGHFSPALGPFGEEVHL